MATQPVYDEFGEVVKSQTPTTTTDQTVSQQQATVPVASSAQQAVNQTEQPKIADISPSNQTSLENQPVITAYKDTSAQEMTKDTTQQQKVITEAYNPVLEQIKTWKLVPWSKQWTDMYKNGQATEEQKNAYAAWDQMQKTNQFDWNNQNKDFYFNSLVSWNTLDNVSKNPDLVYAKTRYNLVSPYKTATSDMLYKWMVSWDIVPGTIAYEDLISVRWWETQDMIDAKRKYENKVKIDNINRWSEITNSSIVWTSVSTKPDATQNVSNSIIETKWMDYAVEFAKDVVNNPEIKKIVEELNPLNTKIKDLEDQKKLVFDKITETYKWITTWAALLLSQQQTKSINEELDKLYNKQSELSSNLKYKTDLATQMFDYKIEQDKLLQPRRDEINKNIANAAWFVAAVNNTLQVPLKQESISEFTDMAKKLAQMGMSSDAITASIQSAITNKRSLYWDSAITKEEYAALKKQAIDEANLKLAQAKEERAMKAEENRYALDTAKADRQYALDTAKYNLDVAKFNVWDTQVIKDSYGNDSMIYNKTTWSFTTIPTVSDWVVSTPFQTKSYEIWQKWVECGSMVNNNLWVPYMFWDSYESKAKYIDSNTPTAWSIFVSESPQYKENWHVWIVKEVLPNGNLIVLDANGLWDKTVREREINPSKAWVTWYVSPDKINEYRNKNVSTKQYTEWQLAVMAALEKTDPKTLNQNWLTVEDYSKFKDWLLPPTNTQKQQAEQILSSVQDILSHKWLSWAVGFGWQKLAWEENIPSWTEAASFKNLLDSFRDNLVIPNLASMKWAMSDKDIQFLRNTAWALQLSSNEEQFKKELQKISDKYTRVLSKWTGSQWMTKVASTDADSIFESLYNQ